MNKKDGRTKLEQMQDDRYIIAQMMKEYEMERSMKDYIMNLKRGHRRERNRAAFNAAFPPSKSRARSNSMTRRARSNSMTRSKTRSKTRSNRHSAGY